MIHAINQATPRENATNPAAHTENRYPKPAELREDLRERDSNPRSPSVLGADTVNHHAHVAGCLAHLLTLASLEKTPLLRARYKVNRGTNISENQRLFEILSHI